MACSAFLVPVPCAGNPTMQRRSTRAHNWHVSHVTGESFGVAGQMTIERPAGVFKLVVWVESRTIPVDESPSVQTKVDVAERLVA